MLALQPLHKWTAGNVAEWMSCLNLFRYAQMFRDLGINGIELSKMDENKLKVSKHGTCWGGGAWGG